MLRGEMVVAFHWLSAVLATYALSRLLWRVPMPGSGQVRLLRVHLGSALLLIAATLLLRGSVGAFSAVLLALFQAVWFLLDRARGRWLKGAASGSRAAGS